jgi:hypothetical protein
LNYFFEKRLISSYIWRIDKKVLEEQEALMRRVKTQDILKEIEVAHLAYYENNQDPEKNFDKWLVNQGFLPDSEIEKQAQEALLEPKQPIVKKTKKTLVLSSYVSGQNKAETKHESNDKNSFKNKKKTKLSKSTAALIHPKEWDYSTKPKEKDYITNLSDFYPRDPYTLHPENVDLVLINKELKGMSLEQVKEFMKKTLKQKSGTDPNSVSNIPELRTPFYYKPKYIIDTQTKFKLDQIDEKKIDSTGLNLYNDPETIYFKQARQFVTNSAEERRQKQRRSISNAYGNQNPTTGTIDLIKSQLNENLKDEKLNIVKNVYGNDLKEFMVDKRHGTINQKYEKVFIT